MKILNPILQLLTIPFRWYHVKFCIDYTSMYMVKQAGTVNRYLHEINNELQFADGVKGAVIFPEINLTHLESIDTNNEFVFIRVSDIL